MRALLRGCRRGCGAGFGVNGEGGAASASTVDPRHGSDHVVIFGDRIGSEPDPSPGVHLQDMGFEVLTVALTGPAFAAAGEEVRHTVVVTNRGPATVTDLTVTLGLPDALTYTGFDGADWTCNPRGRGRELTNTAGCRDTAAGARTDES
jgi:uncharacterized repeat protein (TIGR01451 family)